MKVILLLILNLFSFDFVLALSESTNNLNQNQNLTLNQKQCDNQTVVNHKEIEAFGSKSTGLIDFATSAIEKAKWNQLAVRMAKVFFTFFLDLLLAEYFGASPRSLSQIFLRSTR